MRMPKFAIFTMVKRRVRYILCQYAIVVLFLGLFNKVPLRVIAPVLYGFKLG